MANVQKKLFCHFRSKPEVKQIFRKNEFSDQNKNVCFVELMKLNLTLKTVLKSDDALQSYLGLKIDFSGNFDSASLV